MNEQELPVSDLLAARRVADAGTDFWNDLEAQLATEPAPLLDATTLVPARDVDTELDTGLDRLHGWRSRRWLIVTAAAAAIVAIIFGINALTEDTGPTPVISDITTTTRAATTTSAAPTTTIPPEEDATPSVDPEPFQLFNPDWQEAIDARLDVSATVAAVDVSADELSTTSGIGADAGSVWISTGNACPCELIRIDPATSQVATRLEFAEVLSRPLVTAGGIWVVAGGTLYRIDPQTNDIVAEIPAPSEGPFTGGIAATSNAVWALAATDCCFPWDHTGLALVRIDPGTNSVVATIGLGVNGFQPVVAARDGDVWVSGGFPVVGIEPTGVERIDPTTDAVVATIELPGIAAILIGDDAVWAFGGDALHRIDPVTDTVVASIPGPNPDGGFDVNFGRVLLENAVIVSKRGWLYRIDTVSNELETVFDLGAGSFGVWHLAIAGDDLWIAGFVPDVARIPLDALSPQPESSE